MMDAALCEILVVNVRQPMDALTYPFPREASQLHFQISSWITIHQWFLDSTPAVSSHVLKRIGFCGMEMGGHRGGMTDYDII